MDAPGFEATQEDYADLIRETFSRSGEDLASVSDAQVNQGIWEKTIQLPHRACIEGGLHGLGHLAYRHEARVKQVVDRILKSAYTDATLRKYAEHAREGSVQ